MCFSVGWKVLAFPGAPCLWWQRDTWLGTQQRLAAAWTRGAQLRPPSAHPSAAVPASYIERLEIGIWF